MRIFTLLLLTLTLSTSLMAQKNVIRSASKYIKAEKYVDALSLLKDADISNNKNALYERGLAYYYTNDYTKAIEDMTAAYNLGVENSKVYLYVGKALHGQHEFRKAVKFYKNYLSFIDDAREKRAVIQDIKRCATGINIRYNDQLGFVENLGSSVNSVYDEVRPVQSPTSPSKYYFSSNREDATGGLRKADGLKDEIYGKYSSDMYAVELKSGNWTAVNAFHPLLNSAQNDILLDFNSSGTVMYFLKQLADKPGVTYTDTFSVDREEGAYPSLLQVPFISELGDRDLRIFNDSSILFSSRREGGHGGYDLYAAVRKSGIWQTPINLGPEVNGPYDEVAPYITKSGTRLYFSSDRLESMGGFDIFESTFGQETGGWSAPQNLGLPINSGDDDIHYSISADGTVGMFSSNRSTSMGGYDLFMTYLKEQITEQLSFTDQLPFLSTREEVVSDDTPITNQPREDVVTPTAPVKLKEYVNAPLYYGSDENILTPQNEKRLKGILDLLKIYPSLKLRFTGHSLAEAMTEFDLYFTVKRAEKASQYFIDRGISPSRISIRGVGSNFPVAKPFVNGTPSSLASKYNRRIDIEFIDVPTANLSIIPDNLSISEDAKSPQGEKLTAGDKGLSYRIHVANVNQMYKGSVLSQYGESIIEKSTGESYSYTVGLYDTYASARGAKNTIVRDYVPEAKIEVYIDGKRVDRAGVEKYKERYPDLADYLLYE